VKEKAMPTQTDPIHAILAACDDITLQLLVGIAHNGWPANKKFVTQSARRLLCHFRDTEIIAAADLSPGLEQMERYGLITKVSRPTFPIFTLTTLGHQVALVAQVKAVGNEDGFERFLPPALREAVLPAAMKKPAQRANPFATVAELGTRQVWGAT
jgi:hypothetical protein